MSDQLKIAIRQETPSPESEFIKSIFPEADAFDPWKTPLNPYDVAVCIGPVKHCPPAKKRVLFVMGMTSSHHDLGWDAVVTTSDKALYLANRKFRYAACCRKLVPPVLQLNAGRKRLVDDCNETIHASDDPGLIIFDDGMKKFSLWGASKQDASMFSVLEFNSMIRGGAVGFYPGKMTDGYDVQVRRHLALGGKVVCKKDPEVIGDFADLVCFDEEEAETKRIKPTVWQGTEDDYAAAIKELIGSL